MNTPTVLTILSAPGTGASSAAAGGGALGTDGSGFACLVQMLLARQGAAAEGGAGGLPGGSAGALGAGAAGVHAEVASVEDPDTEARGGQAADDRTETVTGDVFAAGAPVPTLLAVAAAETTGTTSPEEAALATGATGAGRGAVTGRTADQPAVAGTVPASEASGASGPLGQTQAGSGETAGGAGSGTPGGTSGGTSGDTSGGATTGPGVAVAGAPADTGTAGQLGSATISAVAGPAAGTTPVGAPAGAGGPVGSQVFPEVVRLVTRGDGTQRLTLRLSPENLGEVRIVVSVRDGAVDVTLAAGAEAQDALLHGSPELRRLLESIGAASTQIAVRDLPSATQSTGSGTAYADAAGGQDPDHRSGDDTSARRDPSGHHPPGHHAADTTGTLRLGGTTTTDAPATGVDLRL